MRKTALLWLFLAALCGGILFQTSQRVNDGRAKLAEIAAEAKKEDESLRVLQAEWSYLNQPDRLEKLSKKYLGLEPLKGKQFAKVADLEARPADAPAPAPAVAETGKPAPAVKPVPEKPAVVLKSVPLQSSPILAPPVAAKPKAPVSAWREQPRTAPVGGNRSFTDVMKSLGVQE